MTKEEAETYVGKKAIYKSKITGAEIEIKINGFLMFGKNTAYLVSSNGIEYRSEELILKNDTL